MTSALIESRGLHFRRGSRAVLEDVNFTIDTGEFVAIVGPNGAGKTTLLRILAGALKPSAGEVFFDGRNLNDWSARDLAMRRAVLSQSTHVAFPFTVNETLRLSVPDVALGRGINQLVAEMLHVVGLSGFGSRVLQELSGGEQQRVHLARVLTQLKSTQNDRPQILFLDEPVAGLDLKHQLATMRSARQWVGPKLTVIAVVHDLNLAGTHASRVLCVHEGKLAADSTPEACLTPALVKTVFGVNAKALGDGQLSFG
jgi:iron complex transport system ATP-binding protein